MTPGTIVVAAVVVAIVALIIVKMVRDRKRGVSSCGCSCEGCGSTCSTSEAK